MTTTKLSIIIPTLNEAETLPTLIDQLWRQSFRPLEIIVCDGGSGDRTTNVAQAMGARVVLTARGRGVQMNGGADLATGSLLLFLHADSRLDDPDLLSRAVTAWQQTRDRCGEERLAGHFPLTFLHQPPRRRMVFRYHEAKSGLNRRHCIHGDQGFLLSRTFFRQLGGFDPTRTFLEDQVLADAIHAQGRWVTLPGRLSTSARRFVQEGVGRRMILNALIMTFHHLDFHVFFRDAPTLYRQQDLSRPLQMAPFFRLVQRCDRTDPWRVVWRRWRRIGAYGRQAAWQPFFCLDLIVSALFGRECRLFLTFHDRLFHPLTCFLPFDLLTAGLIWIWFQASRLYFAWTDRPAHDTTEKRP